MLILKNFLFTYFHKTPFEKSKISNSIFRIVGFLRFLILALFAFFISVPIFALHFVSPKAGDTVLGFPQTTEVKDGEDFSDVAMRTGIGFYELYEANPSFDTENPPSATELIIPTQYVLPKEFHENLVLVNLAEMRIYFRPYGRNMIYVFPVGIGKVDWDTPLGMMSIAEKVAHPTWRAPASVRKNHADLGDILPTVIPAGPENPLGSYKLRLSNPNYLIHGTNIPAGVGRRSSAGCMRLYEQDIDLLFHMVKIGTPVLIINQPYKVGWLNGKLYLEAHLPLLEQRIVMGEGDRTLLNDAIMEANKTRHVKIDWKKAYQIADEHLGVPRPIGE